ncbi:MAG TPA: ABC transporter substrate-binding protein [Modicisalibacter sp.]|nr:ABC transporter substrate-binding protein [Modicisalibacter sp.]
MNVKKRFIGLVAGSALLSGMAGIAQAQEDPIKIGMITTLSGGGSSLGIDIRDGFMLAVNANDGKLGGKDVEVLIEDDSRRPDKANQIADKFIQRDEVDILTGIVWSNLALAVVPKAVRDGVFYISPNAGPSELAGRMCHENYFNVAYQNDNQHEAMGEGFNAEGFENAFLLAPNYPAGRDAITGFKRFYEGEIAGEIFTQLGQQDYAAEIAAIRASNADSVFIFLPGGMGISFVKQYDQAQLQLPLRGPGFTFSQDVLPAMGEAALGARSTAQWSPDLDNPANEKFVSAFQEAYGRLPSVYASQAYDAAHLIGSALEQASPDDADAFRAALMEADFESVRGDFEFGSNHHPIQDFYLREVAKVDGIYANQIVRKVFDDHQDAYVDECSL